jgi:hypothetical protein
MEKKKTKHEYFLGEIFIGDNQSSLYLHSDEDISDTEIENIAIQIMLKQPPHSALIVN